MYQEREYQRQPQQPYREWDERQQQRFPESPLAQYQPHEQQQYPQQARQQVRQSFPQPYQGQGHQPMNVGQSERQISVAAGAALLLYAAINRSRTSLIHGSLGAYLIWRGQTGHCPLYQAMDINTAQSQRAWQGNGNGQPQRDWRTNTGVQQIPIQQQNNQQQSNQIEIRRAVTVDKPAEELYNFWRKLENLPQFMHHLERVEQTSERSSHWKAKIAGGIPVEWDAEIVEDVPGQRIAWRTKPDSQVQQSGVVEFKPATAKRGTVVNVDLHYSPPGGIIGETFARMLNGITAQQVKDDIGRFKSLMEAGEIAKIEGQPTGR